MAPLYLILLSALDIILYTARSYTSKLYADSCHEEPIQATLVFSAITGFVGYFLTILFSGGLKSSLSVITLFCGVSAGMVLFLYNLGYIRAAKTGPYAIQSIIGLFGCVLLPLLFERLLWDVTLYLYAIHRYYLRVVFICVSEFEGLASGWGQKRLLWLGCAAVLFQWDLQHNHSRTAAMGRDGSEKRDGFYRIPFHGHNVFGLPVYWMQG